MFTDPRITNMEAPMLVELRADHMTSINPRDRDE